MNDKRKMYVMIGALFAVSSCLFILGTINHLFNTGEGVVSSGLLALGAACAAVFFLKKR